MSADQLEQLVTRILGAAGGAAQPQGSALAVGPMGACVLGIDKMKRPKVFQDWMKEAQAKIDYMGINDDKQKVALLKSWAGRELLNFWEKEARIQFTVIPAVPAAGGVAGVAEIPADTFEQIVQKTRQELLKHVSRDRSLTDLLSMKQGDETWMQFISELEDAADLCRLDTQPLTREDAIRVAGMKDRLLAEKAMTEEFQLARLVSVGSTRESSKSNVEAMEGNKSGSIRRVPEELRGERENRQLAPGIFMETGLSTEDDLDRAISNLTVMKLKKAGKYSIRSKGEGDRKSSCTSCSSSHETGRCPARGRECFECGEMNHFARSKACTKTSTTKGKTTKKVTEADGEEDFEESDQDVNRVTAWPGYSRLAKKGKDHVVGKVTKGEIAGEDSKWVHMKVGGRRMNLFTDTGSGYTIIPPDMFRPSMGKIKAADTILRSWGSKIPLDVKGMFETELETRRGARRTTKVFVVQGFRPEPLLGDEDAAGLGFITFNPRGREATEEEKIMREKENTKATVQVSKIDSRTSIPDKIRQGLGVQVLTEQGREEEISAGEKAKTMSIVEEFQGSVFTGHIGKIKTEPIHLDYDQKFKPTQPPYHPTPLHYRDKLSKHLEHLREEGVITDVDPRQTYDCVLNVVISEKATPGEIRMNIDNVPMNKGMKRTKFHVKLPQNIRHELEGAKIFSEMDMPHGFHQLPLDEESKNQCIFQTHEGLHRMERLFFGPTSSSGIFHHEVEKALRGVPGCISIHDNILVFGATAEEHRNNLRATLERCREKGITLKLAKSTFGKTRVKWFGRVFSADGVSADPAKIKIIQTAGRPTTTDEVRSLIQAAAYNAKFTFDHKKGASYEETTAPLRELLVKGARFKWDRRREEAYSHLMSIMSSTTTLRPYVMDRTTHFVSDASPEGIQASLYQELEDRSWVPVDHTSRALTEEEKRWGSQIDWESLAKSWGMEQFRYYLSGCKFTSWGDQQPLIPLYNDLAKKSSVRIAKHRMKIQDLVFTDKYIRGKDNPCDFGSRHPAPLTNLSDREKEKMGVEDEGEVWIRRLFMSDLPDAVSVEMLQEVADKDTDYVKLRSAVREGNKPKEGELTPYMSVWTELGVVDNLVCREDRLVVPSVEMGKQAGNIRTWLVDIAHDGHHGADAMKRYLRARLWFPGMDRMVERRAAGCLDCQAATPHKHRDPLKPTKTPSLPWRELAVDHWGPTKEGKHLLVVVDYMSRYPEVEVVNGTSATANVVAFDNIFSRHGFPKVVRSDNGAPFNGKDRHELQQYFAWAGIKHIPNKSAYDPEATGLVEAFMKHLGKIWHTSITDRKDPYMEINKHLRVTRATPHISTGKSPAEILFGRKFITRLPDMRVDQALGRKDIQEALEEDKKAKERQKKYKDQKRYVGEHNIRMGDKVLMERKTTKTNSPYDPNPYTVSQTHGTQITATREGVSKTRDAQKWKKVVVVQKRDYDAVRRERKVHTRGEDYLEIGGSVQEEPGKGQVQPPLAEGQGGAEQAAVQQGTAQATGGRARQPVREGWSFQPPVAWSPPARRQPTTRAMSARRERDRRQYE